MNTYIIGALLTAVFLPIYAWGCDWHWGRALGLFIACVIGGLLSWLALAAIFQISPF